MQDLEEGLDDITPLIQSLEKIRGIINKAGFGNKFTKKERELWNNIFTELLDSGTITK
jgi:hypothetical protein